MIFVCSRIARRPWEAPSNQVTSTWQAFTESIHLQQDSKGNFPFQNIATKTLHSHYNAYLGLKQYWTEKVDPDDSQDEDKNIGRHPQTPSQEICNGMNDIFKVVRNFQDAKVAKRDGQKIEDWMEEGHVQEMKAKELLHLDQAFDLVIALTKTHSPSTLSFHSAIRDETITDHVGNDDEDTSYDDVPSCTYSPEGSNRLLTTSRCTSRTHKGVQKKLQDLKERKLKINLSYSRSVRITNVKKQKQHRFCLNLQNFQIQANITLRSK